MTFGIPEHLLPVTENGEMKLKKHVEWMKLRIKQESLVHSGVFNAIELPLHTDILLRKGKRHHGNGGMAHLHALVDQCLPAYEGSSRKDRSTIVADIVAAVKDRGGRFLSMDTGIWVEVDDTVATEKVSQLFRSRKKAKRKAPA